MHRSKCLFNDLEAKTMKRTECRKIFNNTPSLVIQFTVQSTSSGKLQYLPTGSKSRG